MKMRKITPIILIMLILCVAFAACGPRNYVLNENTFFLVMTNIQAYPQNYLESNLEFDCFTYELVDVDGNSYMCGVRQCSAGYGCQCGKDTIIGFILEYDGELPEPRNQSDDSNDKTWVHLSGKVKSAEAKTIHLPSYLDDGSVDPNNTDEIKLLVYTVDSCVLIENYSNLKHYVTK